MILSATAVIDIDQALSKLEKGGHDLGSTRVKLVNMLHEFRGAHRELEKRREALVREVTGIPTGPARIKAEHLERWNVALGQLLATTFDLAVSPLTQRELFLERNAVPYDEVIEPLRDHGMLTA